MSLDNLVIKLKCLGIENLHEFSFIDLPDKISLENSINNMKMIECLD